MTDWFQRFDVWRAIANLRSFPPADAASIEDALRRVKGLPVDLRSFLEATNGLVVGPFKMLPVFDGKEKKRTWDSVQRANDPKSTRFLNRSSDLLERFVVFADVGAGRAAVFDRRDASIWYEEEGGLRQTDLTLEEFLEFLTREAASV